MTDDDESSAKDDRTKDDDPRRALSGFLSDSTRRVRRTLLAVSVGAIAVVELKLNFATITVFGNVVAIQDRQWIVKAGELVLTYLMLAFVVYVAGDLVRSWDAIKRAVGFPPPWAPPTRTPRYEVPFSMTVLLLMIGRVVVDVALPFFVGVIAMIRWK